MSIAAITETFYKEINECCGKTDNKPIITFDDIPATKLKFVNGFKCKSGVHIGQRKLFLSEIQFLTNFYIQNPQLLKSKKIVYVVYAGAAPAHHTFYLATYFPYVRFILVDPNRFELRASNTNIISTDIITDTNKERDFIYLSGKYENKTQIPRAEWLSYIKSGDYKICIVEEYFTDELARIFSELNPIFISDIRTNEEENKPPTDQDFIWNNAMQYNWAHLIKPCALLYKFRMPFFESKTINPSESQKRDFDMSRELGIDFVADYNKSKFQYIKGDIYLQAFPGNASSESRLCVLGPFKKTSAYIGELNFKNHYYNVQEYENKYFYYNTIQRTIVHHYNPFSNKQLGFDHCNDCSIECDIWHKYSINIKKINIQHAITNLSNVVNRDLFMSTHGYFFYPNLAHINKSINYPHINKNRITLNIKENQTIKTLPDMKYSTEFILDELTKNIPDKYRTQYKECIKKSFRKDILKKTIDDIIEEFPLMYNTKTYKPLLHDKSRKYILDILRFLNTADIDELIIIGNYKAEKITALKQIIKINVKLYISYDHFITKYTDSGTNKKGVIIDNDYEFYIHRDIIDNCKLAENIIKKVKPKYFLIKISLVDTIFNNKKEYETHILKKNIAHDKSAYPINSIYKKLKISFFDGQLWLSPYSHYRTSKLLLYGTDYKKYKIWDFDKLVNKYMYYLAFTRCFSYINNMHADTSHTSKLYAGYDNCHDCAMCDYILIEYSKNNNISFDKLFSLLNKLSDENLLNRKHGYIYDNNISRLQKLFIQSVNRTYI
jgi:hypothetical protein